MNAITPTEAPALPRLNEPAPDFDALTTHGRKTLSDYRGKWLVLFSHPADFTPVCTTEFMAFARRADEFAAMNTELLGLSIDSHYAHIAWVRSIKASFGVDITFPIIADLDMAVATAYGISWTGDAPVPRSLRARRFWRSRSRPRRTTPASIAAMPSGCARIIPTAPRPFDEMAEEEDDPPPPPDRAAPRALRRGHPADPPRTRRRFLRAPPRLAGRKPRPRPHPRRGRAMERQAELLPQGRGQAHRPMPRRASCWATSPPPRRA
jgi:peroxiredoxin